MWKFFRRSFGESLGSSKTRRSVSEEHPLRNALAYGWYARAAILALFVAGLAVLVYTGDSSEPTKRFLLCFLIFLMALAQMWINHPLMTRLNSRLGLVLTILFVHLALIKLIYVQVAQGQMQMAMAPLFVPYAFAPLALSVLLGKDRGLFAAVYVSLWGALLLGRSVPVFLVISLLIGFVAVFLTLQVRKRSQLVRAGLGVGAATWLLAAVFGEIGPVVWEAPYLTDWEMIVWQSVAAIGIGFGTAIIVSGLLPVFEYLFGITTDISWLEMSDLNNPLLKRLSLEAPGTFHHSLAVANLAEAAAEKVGANPTICRACAYFHDIGKLIKPEYFIENIRSGHNPHDSLTPTMSALVIISHVKEGVDIALKHNLNPLIIDAILQHHGTSLVSYFYNLALHQCEDARAGGKIMNIREEDIPEVTEENFRYPGPRVLSKETAIVSLADMVESAARSVDHPTQKLLNDLVHDLVQARINDHQLDQAPLTLAEIHQVAESLASSLVSMLHTRIAYPKNEQKNKRSQS